MATCPCRWCEAFRYCTAERLLDPAARSTRETAASYSTCQRKTAVVIQCTDRIERARCTAWRSESDRCGSGRFVEHHQGPRLDALARHEVTRTCRISKTGVRHETRAYLGPRVIALEEQEFIGLHIRRVEPAVRGVIPHRVDLAMVTRHGQVVFAEVMDVGGDEILA